MKGSGADSRRRDGLTPSSIVVLAVGLGVFGIAAQHLAPFSPDDAFISYRFAENLAAGHGLGFNRAEPPVEAYSNFLWILLLTPPAKLGLDLPYWAPRMGAGLGLLCIAALWLSYQRSRVRPAAMVLPLVLFATFGPFVLYAVSGMETAWFAFLLLLLVLCVDLALASEKLLYWLGFSAAGLLLAMTRPEGVLAFPLAVIYVLLTLGRGRPASRLRMNLLISSFAFLVLLVAFQAWRIQYYGELLPTPFWSKGGGGRDFANAWSVNRSVYFSKQGTSTAPFGFHYLALILIAAVGVSMSEARSHARHVCGLALFLGLAFSLVYPNFIDWMPGMRYHAPLAGLLLVPWVHIRGSLGNSNRGRLANLGRLVAMAAAILAVNLAGMAQLKIEAEHMENNLRANSQQLGEWLKRVLPPDSLVALSDVGVLPYYAGFQILDIHPESLTDIEIAREGFSVEYFLRRGPDAVMFHSRGILEPSFRDQHATLVEDPRFARSYRFVGVTRFRWRNDLCYWLYVRREHRISREELARFPTGIGGIRHVDGRALPAGDWSP